MGNCSCIEIKKMKTSEIPVIQTEESNNQPQKNLKIYINLADRNSSHLNENLNNIYKKFKTIVSNHSTDNSYSSFINHNNQSPNKTSLFNFSKSNTYKMEKKNRNVTPTNKVNKYIPKNIKEELNNSEEKSQRKYSRYSSYKSLGPIFSKLCEHSKRNRKYYLDD